MNKFDLIINHISDGVMEIDHRGNIVYCNKKIARLDDVVIADIIGKPLLSVYPSLNQDTSTLHQVLRSGNPIINFTQTFTNYKGKVITTINTTLPIKKGSKTLGAIEISRDITEVKQMSERIADLQRRMYQNASSKGGIAKGDDISYTLDDIITKNEIMIKLKAKALKASILNVPVLVCGDTGTGKELFVQAIHAHSDRVGKPFIAQNCAALPANLLEGILFGTVEGAFTGATNRPGLLETADGGTIFLDEINSMPLELQAKLLRFLQDGWLRRIGDNHSKKVDVRVIAALNTLPEEALKSKDLRQDLYYRLNTITIELPTLKERREDIALLSGFFIKKYNRYFERRVRGLSEEVMTLFNHYEWPGNVRELEHVIQGAMSMLDGQWITLAEVPAKILRYADFKNDKKIGEHSVTNLAQALKEFEDKLIADAMVTSGNNVTQASKKLGLPRQTLQYKLKKRQ